MVRNSEVQIILGQPITCRNIISFRIVANTYTTYGKIMEERLELSFIFLIRRFRKV